MEQEIARLREEFGEDFNEELAREIIKQTREGSWFCPVCKQWYRHEAIFIGNPERMCRGCGSPLDGRGESFTTKEPIFG